jgi:hypothetical protein
MGQSPARLLRAAVLIAVGLLLAPSAAGQAPAPARSVRGQVAGLTLKQKF